MAKHLSSQNEGGWHTQCNVCQRRVCHLKRWACALRDVCDQSPSSAMALARPCITPLPYATGLGPGKRAETRAGNMLLSTPSRKM